MSTKINNTMSELELWHSDFEMTQTEDGYVYAPAGSKGFDRRDFMKSMGLMVVGFSVSGAAASALTEGATAEAATAAGAASLLADPATDQVDSYVAIGADGFVTFSISRPDHGQGVVTGFMQIVAEELDVSFAKMRAVIGDTALVANDGGIAGSNGISGTGPKLRRAGALARAKLLELAAAKLGVAVDKLTVNDGVISVIGDPAKSVSYAELIAGKRFAIQIPATLPATITTKPVEQYKIVGQPIPRIEIPGKLTGEFEFVNDVRLPGMLHARTLRPRGQAFRQFFDLKSVDDKSIAGVKGLVKVIQVADMASKTGFNGHYNFVGVVCEREEQAVEAAAKLKVTWGTPPEMPADLYEYLFAIGRTPTSTLSGDINAVYATSSKTLSATYKYPFQMHGPLGSVCAVADVKVDGAGKVTSATVWSGTQSPYGTRTTIGNALGIPTAEIPDRVRIIWRSPAGTYGTNAVGLCDVDAALLSQATGRPVRLQWFREDSHGYDFFGPLYLINLKAALDSSGKVVGWDWDSWGGGPEGANSGQRYAFGTAPATFRRVGGGPTGGNFFSTAPLRAPNASQCCFATEQFIDELANAAKMDTIQYRLAHLDRTVSGQDRLAETLVKAAEKFNWDSRPSPNPANANNRTGKVRGRGIAHGGFANTFVSEAVEVEVDQSTGVVKLLRVVAAHDCGLIINPESIKQQVEGNVVMSGSRALLEEVKHDGHRVSTLDWVTYPILRLTEFPKTDVVLINRPTVNSTGVGEPAVVPMPAAVANAVFDATGVRIRQAPLTPERVLAALKAR